MTDLNDFIKDNPEAQAALEAMVSEQASTATATATAGLKDRNNELMDELKPHKELATQLGDDFNLDDYKKLRDEAAAKLKDGYVEKGDITRLMEAHDAEKDTWKKSFDDGIGERDTTIKSLNSEVERLLIDGELSRELGAIAVDETARDYLIYKAKPLIEIAEKDGKKIARVINGVKGDGTYKTIKELAVEFGADEANARYIKGTGQTGSGASGSGAGGAAGSKTINRQALDALGPAERSKFFKDGGKVN